MFLRLSGFASQCGTHVGGRNRPCGGEHGLFSRVEVQELVFQDCIFRVCASDTVHRTLNPKPQTLNPKS